MYDGLWAIHQPGPNFKDAQVIYTSNALNLLHNLNWCHTHHEKGLAQLFVGITQYLCFTALAGLAAFWGKLERSDLFLDTNLGVTTLEILWLSGHRTCPQRPSVQICIDTGVSPLTRQVVRDKCHFWKILLQTGFWARFWACVCVCVWEGRVHMYRAAAGGLRSQATT